MTFAELTAAIWDQRNIPISTVAGMTVWGVPLALDRRPGDQGRPLWLVHYRTSRDTVANVYTTIDAFEEPAE